MRLLLLLFSLFLCMPSLAQRYPPSGGGGCAIYANQAALPLSSIDGTCATTTNTSSMWVYSLSNTAWELVGTGGSTVTSIATFGSVPNNAGGVIASNVLTLEPADGTHPGGVSTGAQTFGGVKTFSSAPNLSSLSASQAVFTDVSKNLTSNPITGSGNVVMSASPTLTGTITAAAANFSGALSASNFSGSSSGTNTGDVTIGTANGLSLVGQALSLGTSSASTTGALSSTDWSTFNGKQAALTIGNLTDAGTDGIVVTGGTGSVIGSGTSFAQHVADSTHNGYLSSTDWSTFNGKQAAGNYITALTGDVTASGPGSVAATLAATSNATLTTLSGLTTASSLASVGTITSGVWNGTGVDVAHGGTGRLTLTNHGVLVGAGTTGITQLGAAAAGTLLNGQGTGSDPSFTATPVLGASGTSGTLGFTGSTSGVVTIQPQAAAGTYNFNLPTTAGSSGQLLTSGGGAGAAMTWSTAPSTPNVVSKTTTYSAAINDYIYASSASFTITLPTAVGNSGLPITIEHAGTSLSQVYTLNTTSAQTIGGVASGSYALYTTGEVLYLISDGSNWRIANHKTDTAEVSYTPTFTGFGTVASVNSYWARRGSMMHIRIGVVAGTVAASTATMTLPGSMTTAASIYGSQNAIVGHWNRNTAGAESGSVIVTAASSTTVGFSVANGSGADPTVPVNGNSILGTGNLMTGDYEVSIAGWQP